MNQITRSLRGNSNAARDIASHLHPYTNFKKHETEGPLTIVRGRGVHVIDDDGKEYIEGMAGLWSASLGFDNERLAKVAYDQLRQLPFYHSFNHRSHEPAINLAEKLLEMAPVPMSKVFFANSGSEANDSVIKMVWYMNNALGRPQKKKIISRIKGYHGVTVASASLTGLPTNHRSFDLPIAGILHTSCPHHYRFAKDGETEEQFATRCAEELDALIQKEGPDTVAAMICEPVMGAGGVIVPPKGYYQKIQAVLKKYDVLLIADEVICGFGRTGNVWGSQTMGFTYSGHPVAAAVALEAQKIYDETDLFGHAARLAPHFQQRLHSFKDHPLTGETMGVGLMGAIEVVADKKTKAAFEPAGAAGGKIAKHAMEMGLIIRNMADRIAVCPPLVITQAETDELFNRLHKAFDATLTEMRADGSFKG
jgi:4-aminobutyrate--pyruvate transaminase